MSINTITVNLNLSTDVRAVLSKVWIAELIEQAKVKPEDGGDVFLHTVYKHSHVLKDMGDISTLDEEFDAELFAKTVFLNGIRKVLGNSLAHFLYTAGGVAGSVSPAKGTYSEVPAAMRAKLLRMEVQAPEENKPLLPTVTAEFKPKTFECDTEDARKIVEQDFLKGTHEAA